MNTAKLVVMLVLVFLVGLLAGSLGTRIYLRHEIERSQAVRGTSEQRVNMIVKRLTGDLKLDDKQKAEVRKIVTTTDALATGVKVLYEPQLKKIYDQNFQRIGQTLNQEQKEKLEKRQKRLSARFNASYFTSLRTAQAAFSDMDTISRSLGLEPVQQSEVSAILKNEKAQEDRIIEKYEGMEQPDLAAVGRDISAVRADSITRLARILTKEQLVYFQGALPTADRPAARP